jgi:hypothetical protein
MKVAQLAQEFMAVLERDYDDQELIEVGIVVELREPLDDNNNGAVHTPTACTHVSRVYQTGLFQWALDSVQWTGEPTDEPDEPEEPDYGGGSESQ